MIGEIVGNYRITNLLASGGMGDVYRGRHLEFPRDVVIKTIRLDNFSINLHDHLKKRFRREALIQAQLDHPHVVRVYEFIPAAANYYLVMEYVNGISLADLLKQGPLEPKRALQIFKQALEALDYAHHHFSYEDEVGQRHTGIIHRDIKPANLLLDQTERLKLTDFGIVKLIGVSGLTRVGFNPGTIAYMSPEQLLAVDELDARSDLYSLGVTLYEMLAGRVPFEYAADGSESPIRKGHLELEPPPLTQFKPEIDETLHAIVRRALNKNRVERFQTALEFIDALEGYERRMAELYATRLRDDSASAPTLLDHQSRLWSQPPPAEPPPEPMPLLTGNLAGAKQSSTLSRDERSAQLSAREPVATPIIIPVPSPPKKAELPVKPRWWLRPIAALALFLFLLAGLAWWYRAATTRIEEMRYSVEYQTSDDHTLRTSGAELLPVETPLTLQFHPRTSGYLYLIAPSIKDNIPFTILTAQPGGSRLAETNRVEADLPYRLNVEKGPNTITVIFSDKTLTTPLFLTQPAEHALTRAEELELVNFRQQYAAGVSIQAGAQETIITRRSAAGNNPLIFEMTLTGR